MAPEVRSQERLAVVPGEGHKAVSPVGWAGGGDGDGLGLGLGVGLEVGLGMLPGHDESQLVAQGDEEVYGSQ